MPSALAEISDVVLTEAEIMDDRACLCDHAERPGGDVRCQILEVLDGNVRREEDQAVREDESREVFGCVGQVPHDALHVHRGPPDIPRMDHVLHILLHDQVHEVDVCLVVWPARLPMGSPGRICGVGSASL